MPGRDQAYIVVSLVRTYSFSERVGLLMLPQKYIAATAVFLTLTAVTGCEQPDAGKVAAAEKIVVAHRGASGYLPEHTIAAKAMAYAQGADYIEQDLVMTKDDEVIVLHDVVLDTVTNVATVHPDRARADGRYYVIDFTLAEIRALQVFERLDRDKDPITAVFGSRFPVGDSTFRVHTLAEELELIQGLNKSTGKSIGVYPEIKKPRFHREHGKDISSAVLDVLKDYGYASREDNIFLQCFDPSELILIHNELMPDREMSLALIQLIGDEKEYDRLATDESMRRIAEYAVGIGPPLGRIVAPESSADSLQISSLTEWAHSAGLKVHAYTFRNDPGYVPAYASSYDELLQIFLFDVGIDGVFTDFPDITVEYLESLQ